MRWEVRCIQYLLLIGSEIAWTYSWSATLGLWVLRTGSVALDLPWLMAVLILGVAACRMSASAKRNGLARLAMATMAGGTLLGVALARLSLRGLEDGFLTAIWMSVWVDGGVGVLAAIGFAAFLWWRALALGRSPMSLSLVEQGFRAGIVGVTTLLVFVALAGAVSPLPAGLMASSTVVVLVAGLIGMPLARVVDVVRREHSEGTAIRVAGPWLAVLLVVVALLMAGVMVLARLLALDRVGALWEEVAGPAASLAAGAVFILAIPFELLVRLMAFLVSLIPRSGVARPEKPQDELRWLEEMQQSGPVDLPPEFVLTIKAALAVGVMALTIWLVLRKMASLRRGWDGGDDVEENRDSLWSWPSLSGLHVWMLQRCRGIWKRVFSPLSEVSMTLGRGSVSVRAIYREFLSLGRFMGLERMPFETPAEYQARLFGGSSLDGLEEVCTLTEGYNLDRYGPPAESSERLHQLASALARLRNLWMSGPRAGTEDAGNKAEVEHLLPPASIQP